MGNVQHITQFSQEIYKKWQGRLRPVKEYKERFNFAQYRIHRNRANHLPVC